MTHTTEQQRKAGKAARKVSPWGKYPAVRTVPNQKMAKQWRESN